LTTAEPSHPPEQLTEEVGCITCGSGEYEVVLPATRDPHERVDVETVFRSSGDEPLKERMVRCKSCGLCYVSPRLQWSLILKGYEGGTDENFVSQASFRETTFGRCLDRVEAAARPPGRRVLDIGAAGGSFLAVARERGYEPHGCEPSGWMCDFARDHYGLALRRGTLFDVPADEPYDLISLWDVLEHTPDPRAALERVRELMRPGGTLAITVPDYGSLAARGLGARWPFLLTVHLYYFERKTIGDLLTRCGFEPLRYQPHLQTLELGYVAQRAAPYLGPLGGLLTGSIGALRLGRLPFHYWVGQTMVVARMR